jgi:hypothetical protein
MRLRRPAPAEVALAVAAIIVAASWYGRGDYDLHAFYCAGSALNHHFDPYRFGYLARCEGQLHAIPAPLPGYDLALFAALARLPFAWANGVFLAACTCAVAVAVACLRSLTRLPAALVIAALFLSDFFVSIHGGQVVAFALGSVTLAAWLAESGNPRVAGAAVLGALVEPHVGLGACIAFALASRPARQPIALGVIALALFSVATNGWNLNWEYVEQVLPRHAASEIAHHSQLSLSHVLHVAGFGDRIALFAGSGSFVVTLVAGVLFGLRLSRDGGGLGFAVTLPPALSLIGGAFIHDNQICLALPAALMAYARFPRWRAQTAVAVCLLAVPWSEVTIVTGQAVATIATIATLAFFFTNRNRPATAAAAGASGVILWLTDRFIGPENAAVVSVFRPAIGWSGFVDDEWRQFVAVEFGDHVALYLVPASLTWLGLGLLAFVLVSAALSGSRTSQSDQCLRSMANQPPNSEFVVTAAPELNVRYSAFELRGRTISLPARGTTNGATAGEPVP